MRMFRGRTLIDCCKIGTRVHARALLDLFCAIKIDSKKKSSLSAINTRYLLSHCHQTDGPLFTEY